MELCHSFKIVSANYSHLSEELNAMGALRVKKKKKVCVLNKTLNQDFF